MPRRGVKTFDCRVRDDYFSADELRALTRPLWLKIAPTINLSTASENLSRISSEFIRARSTKSSIDAEWANSVLKHSEALLDLLALKNSHPQTLHRSSHRVSTIIGHELSSTTLQTIAHSLHHLAQLAGAALAHRSDDAPGTAVDLTRQLTTFFHQTFDLRKGTRRKREDQRRKFVRAVCGMLSRKLVCGDLRLALELSRWSLPVEWTSEQSEIGTALERQF